MTPTPPAPLFPHGRMFLTESIVKLAREGQADILKCLDRHLSGDWGDIQPMRRDMNDVALAQECGAIISRYELSPDVKIVIVTTADRSLTKLMLLPEFLDDIGD